MPKKTEKPPVMVADAEIVRMFFGGRNLKNLSKYVATTEETTQARAKGRVEQILMEYYLKKGYE